MGFGGSDQQVHVVGSLSIDFIVGHNLVFGLLQFHHLAKFVRLAGFSFADDFRRGLEQAENLAVGARVAAQDARSGLLHHLPDERHHRIELAAQVLQRQLLQDVGRSFHARGDLGGKTLCLPTTRLVEFSNWL
jgi:hypothetical protein